MKKTMLVIFYFFASINFVEAQTERFRVKAGDDITDKISEFGKYRFKDFEKARLYYSYGKFASGKLNYNYLVEEMQFINQSGDTLALSNPEQITYIVFDSAVFFYNEGFMELVFKHDSVSIARKQKATITYEKIGAYGQPNPTSSIDNYRNYADDPSSRTYRLIVNRDAVILKQITWYLVKDSDHKPVKADKAGVMKLFPQHNTEIKAFIKDNKDAFKTIESINKLLGICLT